jgi:hypothetical protein
MRQWYFIKLSIHQALQYDAAAASSVMHLCLFFFFSPVDLKEILRAHTYVGCVDFNHALIQHSTYLYLVNYREIA